MEQLALNLHFLWDAGSISCWLNPIGLLSPDCYTPWCRHETLSQDMSVCLRPAPLLQVCCRCVQNTSSFPEGPVLLACVSDVGGTPVYFQSPLL